MLKSQNWLEIEINWILKKVWLNFLFREKKALIPARASTLDFWHGFGYAFQTKLFATRDSMLKGIIGKA